ncbi:MAG: hypothetical protein EOM40_07685 [Clostridia bacterium]|nr:hypothetical protein [Clostridia bacterium]
MARKSRKQETALAPQNIVMPEVVFHCGVYGRLSLVNSGKQDQGDSIENQLSICNYFIEGQDELNLVDTYIDNGKKGTSFERPEFKRLMEDVRSGKINCIVVKDLSRFGRDYLETGEYLERIFPFLGVRFIAITDSYDSLHASSDEEHMTVPLRNMSNELYAKDISKKVCTSIHARMEKGQFLPGRLCYGYIRSPLDDFTLIPDPVTADYVKLIFELRYNGASYEAIRKHLDSIHAITPSQRKAQLEKKESKQKVSAFWYATGVSDILSNPVYIGHLVHGKESKALYKGQRQRKEAARSEWKVYPNMHEPLVAQEVYDYVQKLNEETKRKYHEAHKNEVVHDNIYRGILKCGDCGHNMQHGFYNTVENKKRISKFSCGKYRGSNGRECSIHSIREDVLHDIVMKQLKFQIRHMADQNALFNESGKEDILMERVKSQISELARKKTRVNRLKGSLYENYSEGLLNESEYLEMKERYVKQEADLLEELERCASRRDTLMQGIADQRKGTDAFRKYSRRKKLDREMLESLIHEIRVYDENRIEVIFRYADVYQRLYELEDSGDEA